MPMHCVRLLLAIYVEVILEVAQGLRLVVHDATNLKHWYRTLVSSSVIAFGHDSEKLVQSRQISPMASILTCNALLNPSKSNN